VQLTPTDLHLLLSGIGPARTRLRQWWQPVAGVTRSGDPVGCIAS